MWYCPHETGVKHYIYGGLTEGDLSFHHKISWDSGAGLLINVDQSRPDERNECNQGGLDTQVLTWV